MDPSLLPEVVWLKIRKKWNSRLLVWIWFCKPLYSSTFTLSSSKMSPLLILEKLFFPSTHMGRHTHSLSQKGFMPWSPLPALFWTPDFMADTQILSNSLIFFRFNKAGICYSFTNHGIKVSSKSLIMFSDYWRETLVHHSSWQDLSADKRIQMSAYCHYSPNISLPKAWVGGSQDTNTSYYVPQWKT